MDKLDVQEDGKCLDGSAELQQMRPCWIGLRKAGATPLSPYYKTIHIKPSGMQLYGAPRTIGMFKTVTLKAVLENSLTKV